MAAVPQIREAPLPCAEPHHTVRDISETLKLSEDVVRELFENEPGVLRIGEARSTGRKRRYVTLRIPRSVFERVYRRLQLQGGE
jgi:hypothetical protein